MRRRVQLLLLVLVALPGSLWGDVAPDPGYSNVSADLIIETNADLSGYRFFLESPIKIEEIKINAGSPTRIDAAGRAGAAKFAKLIAVPIENFGHISGDLSGPLLESFIRERRFPDARELFSHNFQTTVSVVEKPLWKPPVYRLSIENGAINAVKESGGTGGSILMYAIPVLAVGVLITIGIAIIGLWLFRRSRKKV